MANFLLFLFSSCLVLILLIFSLSATVPSASAARPHSPHISNFKLVQQSKTTQRARIKEAVNPTLLNGQAFSTAMHMTNNAHATRNVVEAGEDFEGAGVIRSSPAHAMPRYNQKAAPAPLPEFPTLGPPIVWSFPATPLPALEAPPPRDMPALPRTGSKHGGPPPPCQGRDRDPRRHNPQLPPSVPFVAAEPAFPPGPLAAPESAPEPTAGGPLSPPYY